MSRYSIYGLREARKIVRDTRRLMKGQSGDYVRGWRKGLSQAEEIIAIHIVDHRQAALRAAEHKP